MSAAIYWHPLSSSALDLGIGSDGDVWIIGTDQAIYFWTGLGWSVIDGAAVRIAVGPSNQPWVVNQAGNVFRRDGASWTCLAGDAADVAVGADGTAWIIGRDQSIAFWNGSAWTRVDGNAVRIAVGPDNQPWVVNSVGGIYRRVDQGWTHLPGSALDIGVGADGTAWVVGTDHNAYYFDAATTNWFPGGVACSNISVDPDGLAWVVQPDAQLAMQGLRSLPSGDRDFVRYLFLRYLGRPASPADVDAHIALMHSRPLNRAQLEQFIATCPEAQQHGPASDKAFITSLYEHTHLADHDLVISLFFRYLGRAPNAGELAACFARLLDGSITGAALDAEFSARPDAVAYQQSSAPLQILGAAYTGAPAGQEDVTSQVEALVRDNRLWLVVNPADFHAPSDDASQSLVIVYRYGDAPPRVSLTPAGGAALIVPRPQERLRAVPTAATATPSAAPALRIFGATYGRSNVSAAARSKVGSGGILYTTASDAEWGAPGPLATAARSLVVVYQLGDGAPVVQVTPVNARAYVGAPALRILGAAYGPADVTAYVAAQVRNASLAVTASSALVGSDPWRGIAKSLVVVFQYGAGPPGVRVVADGQPLSISPETQPAASAAVSSAGNSALTEATAVPPLGLNVLGAAHGLLDVTSAVQALVQSDSLNISPEGPSWRDSWPGVSKTLVVVYQIDGGKPMIKIARQSWQLAFDMKLFGGIQLAGPVEPLVLAAPAILGAAYGPLDVTDKVASLVRDGQRAIAVNNDTFADSFSNHAKALVVFYRYGQQRPQVAIAQEGATLQLSTQPSAVAMPATGELQLLGASYGLGDISPVARAQLGDRDFVGSLFVRYLGRAATPADVDAHLGMLNDGHHDRAQLEQYIASVPEALAHGPVTDRDFVGSLFVRYLGRAADPAGMAARCLQLSSGQLTRAQLEEDLRTGAEAAQHASVQRCFHADSATWGDGWPGQSKLLVLCYQVGSGPPRLDITMEGGTLTIPTAPPAVTACIQAQVRLLADYQVAPAQQLTVQTPGLVIRRGSPAPVRVSGASPPTHKGVHQVVLTPLCTDGSALPDGTLLTLMAEAPVDLLCDLSGQTTLYHLAAHVPLQIAVPPSGRCRFSIETAADQLTCPLLRARWEQMPPDVWAVIAPDLDLHKQMAAVTAAQLVSSTTEKTSPLAQSARALAQAHALAGTLNQAMRFCADAALRVRRADGSLWLVPGIDLGSVKLPQSSNAYLPPHVVVPAAATLSRTILSGAARLAAARATQAGHASSVGMVTLGLGDDLGGVFRSIGSGLSSIGSTLASTATSAFAAVVNGAGSIYVNTAEGLHALVSVADRVAQSVSGFSDDVLHSASHFLLDASNGLYAYAISFKDGVLQILRTAVSTIEDVARIVSSFVLRLALQLKQIIEFLLMLQNWGDIVETQRYLLRAINKQLDAIPTLSSSAGDALRGAIYDLSTLIDIDHGKVTPSGSTSAIATGLGEAFEFLSDRFESFMGDLGFGGGGEAATQSRADLDKIRDTLSALVLQPPLVELAQRSFELSDPSAVLAVLRQAAQSILAAVQDLTEQALAAMSWAAPVIKGALNTRLYIPVLTELIELFVFKGDELTPLSLITLLAGAAYTFIYKITTLSSHGPVKQVADPPVYTALVVPPQTAATPAAPQASTAASTTSSSPRPKPVPKPAPQPGSPQPAPSADPPSLAMPYPAVLGLNITQAVAATVGFGLRRVSSTPTPDVPCDDWMKYGSLCAMLPGLLGFAVTIGTMAQFGNFFASETTYHAMNFFCASQLYYARTRGIGSAPIVQQIFGVAQMVPALVTGIALLAESRDEPDVASVRMFNEFTTGLADLLAPNPAASKKAFLVATLGKLGLAVDQIVKKSTA